jgi:hypothetical protein
MFAKLSLTTLLFTTSFLATMAQASDTVYAGGGVLPQIVDGGGTKISITLVNLDDVPAPYTLYFYDDNGNPLSMSTTSGAPSSILSGTLDAHGSATIQTNGGGATTLQGWALLVTQNTIAGTAVFGVPMNGSYAEASSNLDTGSNTRFGLPFDGTTSVTGVAIANSWLSTPLVVGLTVYDLHGNQLLTDTIVLQGYGHTSFVLTARYPQLAGQQGFAVFSGSYDMNVLGLRATGSTFTSVTPVVASGW